jgi:phenylacetate-CoA ligase
MDVTPRGLRERFVRVWNWRRAGFFALDRLRGHRYQRNLDELAAFFADPDAFARIAGERLERFLDHATATTDAYAPFRNAPCLQDFPVLAKRDLVVNRHAYTSRVVDPSSLSSTSTSGSYGTPFTFPQTDTKRVRQQSEVIFFNRWAGLDVGYSHLFCGVSGGNKSRFTRFLQNETWFYPGHLDDFDLAAHCALLRVKRIASFVLHPSLAVLMARQSVADGYTGEDYALTGVVALGEALTEPVRDEIEAAFGCPVYARFSARELGVLAHECPVAQTYHLNLSSFVVELLSLDCDAPAPDGHVGRVVVTDMHSHAMPLIRYDTGDLAVRGDGCACDIPGPTLTSVLGRIVETIHDPQGNPIYPIAVNDAMVSVSDVIQFRFVQRGAGSYTMQLHALPSFSEEDIVRQRLVAILGSDARITFEYVDDIPPLPSGKRPYVVNEWYASQPPWRYSG